MTTRICSAIATVIAFTFSASLSAYELLSPERTWDSPPTYIVDQRGVSSISDDDGGVSATVDAIKSNQAWNGAGANTVINAQSGPVTSFQLGDGTPMLNFRDPVRVCNGNCLAATFIGYYQSRSDGTWRIYDADIVTNTKQFSWTSENEQGGCSGEFYIEGVQVHEAGHGLGLGHTNVSGATMYPSVSSCNNSPATIAADDKAGLFALYGGGGVEGGDDPPPSCALGQFGDSCSSNEECCSGKCRGKQGSQQCK